MMRSNFLRYATLALVTIMLADAAMAASPAEKIRTVQIEAAGSRYEPQQYITPYSQSRHVSDYRITVTWNPRKREAREDWKLDTIYPFPANLAFHAIYHEDRGERTGRDGFRPSGEGPIAPARIGAVFKDLWLSNPTILAAFASSVAGESLLRDGVQYQQSQLSAFGTEWNVLTDPTTGLVAEVDTSEGDPLEGHVQNRIVFSDWREVSGVMFPFKLAQYVDDKLIRRETRRSIEINTANAGQQLQLEPGELAETDQGLRQWGWSMSHFFLRRMAMGAPADQDQSRIIKFSEVGKGIYQVLGSSHHNLVIVGPRGLAINEAVWYPRRSEAILRELHKRWPDKPLKYVILTHHHVDHTGGLLPYAKAGAMVVVGKNNEAYFKRILSKALHGTPKLTTVRHHASLNGIGRRIDVYEIMASHAAGYIATYIPDAKLLFNSDLYSPGRPTQKKLWAKELLDAINFYGIDVETHVGGHGMGTRPNQELVELTAAQ